MSDKSPLHEETHLKVLRLLEATPQMNQRDLAQALGVSLKTKGTVPFNAFRNNP